MALAGLLLGGMLGTLARYLVGLASQQLFGGSFPLGTVLVNVLGCFLMGLLAGARQSFAVSPSAQLALGTGFLGAFTTFSAFALDSHTLAQGGAFGRASLYVLVNLVGGYLALVAGRAAALRSAGVVG